MSIDQSDPYHPRVGDRITVTIDTLASGGDGIARQAGFTIFVPYSAPGDVAEIELTEVAKNFGRARVISIQQPGPDRIAAPCPHAAECAGCRLQHLRYSAQLAVKENFVRDGLERIGHVQGVEVRPTIGMDDPWHYRNKGEFIAQITDGQVRLGYHAEGGAGFVPVTNCPIQHPLAITLLHAVEAVATEFGLPLAQLITRVSPSEDTALAILVCWEEHEALQAAAQALQQRVPELAGVLWSRVRGRSVVRRTLAESLTGSDKLVQRLGPWRYTVSAESFFQVNSQQALRLLEQAQEFAGDLDGMIFADGYCGVGTFLLPLASQARSSIGIEEHPVALHDAEINVEEAGLRHVHLYEARVDTILTRMLRKGRGIDVALIDPPRKGAGRVVLESLAKLGVQRIVLVSCDPATFGRDAGDLQTLGYRLTAVQPVDMFPQTWHVETIALAEKA